MTKYKIGDKVEIVKKDQFSVHDYEIGDVVKIFRINYPREGFYDTCSKSGDCYVIHEMEIQLKKLNIMQQMTKAVVDTAKRLLKPQNKVTTLEIKAELIKTHSQYFWTQATVSAIMDDAQKAGMFTFYDTVTGGNMHRVYSGPTTSKTKKSTKKKMAIYKPAPKRVVKTVSKKEGKKTISKTKALELMTNSKGHFFTATFISKKGERTINCQYLKDQKYSHLGYIKVKEAIKAKMDEKDAIRQINLQTLSSLKIAGNSYRIK